MGLFSRYSFLLAASLSCLYAAPVDAADETCKLADTAIADASGIRKLKIRKNVPCFVHDKDQVKKFLLHTIDTKIPPQKLFMEATVYKALGIIPAEFDYQQGIVDLYLNQIGGYYNPQAKHFVMAGWLPGILQTTVAVHELTHALQDQYFNLEAFTDEKKFSGDELLARSALVEGDATAVMVDYTRRLMGQPQIENEKNVDSMMLQNVIGSSLVAGMNTIPTSLQMTLIFPYTSGLRFAHTLLMRGSYGEIDKAFRRAPRSTEEILHPEKYLIAKQDFEKIDAASLIPKNVPAGLQPSYQDSLGEFSISTLLANFVTDKNVAALAAAGWGGDTVAVFEDKTAGKRYVAWKTLWDSEKDADEFFQSYTGALAKVDIKCGVQLPPHSVLPGAVHFSKSGKVVDLLVTQPIA